MSSPVGGGNAHTRKDKTANQASHAVRWITTHGSIKYHTASVHKSALFLFVFLSLPLPAISLEQA